MSDVDSCQADQHGYGGKHLEIDQGLQPHPAQAAHLSVGGDAGDQGPQDQRGNDGLDQPQEDVAEYTQADSEGRSVGSQLAAGEHGPEDPDGQRTLPPGAPTQQHQPGNPESHGEVPRSMAQSGK